MESSAGEAATEKPAEWRPLRKAAFLWLFCYFLLYYIPHPPALWLPLVSWIGKSFFHFAQDVSVEFTGSGDTTYHYMLLLCNLTLSAAIAVCWAVLDRKRANYARLEARFQVFMRMVLGATMLSYGFSKIFEGQFPQPGPSRLIETFGEASPMGLLWTFMGASRPYSIFGGLAEVVPGLMLFCPPVAALGAFLCSLVMFHIFMLNMCYDVPVKIYSCQLFLQAFYLAFPAIKRLTGFFILNKPVTPLPAVPLFKKETSNEIGLALQVFIGVLLLTYTGWGASMRERREYHEQIANTPMYGVWRVEKCAPAKNSDGLTDLPWKTLIFEYPGYLEVRMGDGVHKFYAVDVQSGNHKIVLSSRNNPGWRRSFAMIEKAPGEVALECNENDVPAHIDLQKMDETKFLLKSRGFHWINEVPYNR